MRFEKYVPALQSLPWQQEFSASGRLTRYTAWLVSPEFCCTRCPYKYGNKLHTSSSFPSWLVELTNEVCDAIGVSPKLLNSLNCNKYESAVHDLYWHSDNEPQFRKSLSQRDTFIVSLSLGSSRKFGIRRKQSLDPEDIYTLDLNHGDLLIMLGKMQTYFEHRIYGGVGLSGNSSSSSSACSLGQTRFNLTWRFQQQHSEDCPSRNS